MAFVTVALVDALAPADPRLRIVSPDLNAVAPADVHRDVDTQVRADEDAGPGAGAALDEVPQVAVVGARALWAIERLAAAGTAVLAVVRPAKDGVDHGEVLAAVRAGAVGCIVGAVTAEAVLRTAAGDAVFSPGLAELVLEASGRPVDGTAALTERETQVLRLVVDGFTGRQIATRLVLSPRTVENHVQRLLRKLGQPNRAALVRYAIENGLA
jgi:DNA-binding NarL/FixJ family response regulator